LGCSPIRKLLACAYGRRRSEDVVNFLLEERGQDVVEYTLLLAFVVLSSAALLIVNAQSVIGIWTASNTLISTANTAAHGS